MLVNFGLISRTVYYLSIELCKPSTDIAYKKDKPSTQIRKRQTYRLWFEKLCFSCPKAMLFECESGALASEKHSFKGAKPIGF